jgi:hypothetical protein
MLPLAKVREATAAKLTEEDPLYLQVRSTTRTRAQWGPRPSMREVSLAQGRSAPSRRARRGLVGLRRLAWGDTRPHAACCRRGRSEGRTRQWILNEILPLSPPSHTQYGYISGYPLFRQSLAKFLEEGFAKRACCGP